MNFLKNLKEFAVTRRTKGGKNFFSSLTLAFVYVVINVLCRIPCTSY